MKKIGILLFAVVIIGIAGWFLQSEPNKTVEKITIADGYGSVFALVYIADAKGYFADEGLDVTFKLFTSGRDALNGVLAGQADIATVFVTPVVLNSIAGKKLAVITELHRSTKNTALIARRDRGIVTVADLRGKRIGLTRKTNAEFFLNLFLHSNQMSLSDVIIVATKSEEMPRKLKEGLVDAVATYSSYLYDTKMAFPENEIVIFFSDVYTEMSVLAGKSEVIKKRPEAFKRVLKAMSNAEVFMQNNKEQALDLVISRLRGQPPQTIRKNWDLSERELGLSHLLQTAMEDQAGWFKSRGMFDGPIPNFRSVIYSDYLRSVNPEAVTIGR